MTLLISVNTVIIRKCNLLARIVGLGFLDFGWNFLDQSQSNPTIR